MIDGVKMEDWDFVFEPENPNCEKKLNDILDIYFENKRNNISSLKEKINLNFLEKEVRRKGLCDNTWIVNLPNTYGHQRSFHIFNYMKKQQIELQYGRFNEMLDSLRYNK